MSRPAQRAMIALGSNLGDRFVAIESALQKMRERGLLVTKTSFLYETEPMYVRDQGGFLNGVCEIETMLDPHELLDALQEMELELGRERLVPKGPRTIDLDILLYGDQMIESERLVVPHPLMLEREFVLQPLADLIPQDCLPSGTVPVIELLSRLRKREAFPRLQNGGLLSRLQNEGLLSRLPKDESVRNEGVVLPPQFVTNLAPHLPAIRSSDPMRPTLIMAILNVTPDSFSDDGLYDFTNLRSVQIAARKFIAQGASIIDVGGQSTKPGASHVSADEEISRVVPAIQAIRAEHPKVAISVDTFYSAVAEAAIVAGADIVNDVSGGSLDKELLSVVARHNKTIVLMHMRGNPRTMAKLTSYPDGIINGVGNELASCVADALAAGIPRWRIILDPGIGFAKTMEQNVEMLRRLDELRHFPGLDGYPWLVGSSRKRFIGDITRSTRMHHRRWGQAAVITASVRGGADIVREHDIGVMRRVVRMAEAIFRNRFVDSSSSNPEENEEDQDD